MMVWTRKKEADNKYGGKEGKEKKRKAKMKQIFDLTRENRLVHVHMFLCVNVKRAEGNMLTCDQVDRLKEGMTK